MVGGRYYLKDHESLPVASKDFTTRLHSWSVTTPQTTRLATSHEATTLEMKHWEPLLRGVSYGSGTPAGEGRGRRKNQMLTCWGRRWPWTGGKAWCACA